MTDAAPSRFLRIVLRADSFATSSAGTITLITALLMLVFTDTVAGFVAATVLFAAWVAVGLTGRRQQRLGERNRTAEDR
jgi:Flp pilus assembly protein TadG